MAKDARLILSGTRGLHDLPPFIGSLEVALDVFHEGLPCLEGREAVVLSFVGQGDFRVTGHFLVTAAQTHGAGPVELHGHRLRCFGFRAVAVVVFFLRVVRLMVVVFFMATGRKHESKSDEEQGFHGSSFFWHSGHKPENSRWCLR